MYTFHPCIYAKIKCKYFNNAFTVDDFQPSSHDARVTLDCNRSAIFITVVQCT